MSSNFKRYQIPDCNILAFARAIGVVEGIFPAHPDLIRLIDEYKALGFVSEVDETEIDRNIFRIRLKHPSDGVVCVIKINMENEKVGFMTVDFLPAVYSAQVVEVDRIIAELMHLSF